MPRFLRIHLLSAALAVQSYGLPDLSAQASSEAATPPTRLVSDSAPAAPANVAKVERLTRILVEDGFANVAVVVEGGRVAVAYENARYRDPRRALSRVAELVQPELAPEQALIVVPTVTAVPILSARFDRQTDGDALPAPTPTAISVDLADIPADLLRARRSSSSFGRIDVVIHPWLEASFGDYDNAVASRTGVAPEVKVALRRGFTLSGQALFTIQDDLPTGESRVRPGVVTVNQTVRLPRNTFISATAGNFANRYGADLQTKRLLASGEWTAAGELAVTRARSYATNGWRSIGPWSTTALIEVAHWITRYRVAVRGTGGMFLHNQRGARLDLVRHFGETQIGWFVAVTQLGTNGGVSLRIPLLQSRFHRPAAMRIRMAEAYRWKYRYHGAVPGGRAFRTSVESENREVTPLLAEYRGLEH